MVFKTKKNLALVFILFLILSFYPTEAKAKIDYGLIDIAFEEFNKLGTENKELAIDYLRSYFQGKSTLNRLKDDLPFILKIVIGDDYESKLQQKNITLDQLKSEIDELKNWSYEDRMAVIDMIENDDAEGVKELLKKYEGDDEDVQDPGAPGTGGPTGQTPDTPQEPSQEPTDDVVLFTDVQGHWAKDYIDFIADKGVIKGKALGIFAPDDNVTRAEFTAMLVRLLGLETEVVSNQPFADVSEKDWFYDVVNTAYSAGLVQGKGNIFDPNGLITREEMVVLIVRAASSKGIATQLDDLELEELLSRFSDREEISHWASYETAVGLKLGLVQGTGPNRFQPKAHATRAQAATVMYNLYNVIY